MNINDYLPENENKYLAAQYKWAREYCSGRKDRVLRSQYAASTFNIIVESAMKRLGETREQVLSRVNLTKQPTADDLSPKEDN